MLIGVLLHKRTEFLGQRQRLHRCEPEHPVTPRPKRDWMMHLTAEQALALTENLSAFVQQYADEHPAAADAARGGTLNESSCSSRFSRHPRKLPVSQDDHGSPADQESAGSLRFAKR